MSWNEPSGGNKGKDPWGNRGNGGGPPDLDEIVRKMQESIGGIFGRKPQGIGKRGGGSPFIWTLILIAIIAIAVFNMTYFIDQQERGVVMRFGQYIKTMQPGLNFALPSAIDTVERINTGQVRNFTHKATMLTQDENIVDVEVAVQWQISEPYNYLFNIVDPALTLLSVTESAVRSVIGKSVLDFVLTEGRSQIAQDQEALIQEILNDYQSGMSISKVEMQFARPPDPVKAAFDDAIKAREDEQRLVNEAEAYRNEILPQARGQAARITEQAIGYKARVIAEAEGDAARFVQVLTEYERAPAVTRERLYLDAIESVMSSTSKVLIDSKGNNSLMYIPIDKLLENSRGRAGVNNSQFQDPITAPNTASQDLYDQADNRSREVR